MLKSFDPLLFKASIDDLPVIQNMARFYVYDMSRYCGSIEGWEMPETGLYECNDLTAYFTDSNRFPFLIRVNGELAGFVLINKLGSSSDVDWNMGEFFVIAKFQRKGIAKKVAFEVFDKFSGIWEVSQMPENLPAIQFWNKVVREYSLGSIEVSEKLIPEPKPHKMKVLKFSSKL